MLKVFKKTTFYLLLSVFVLFGVIFVYSREKQLKVHFFDVGEGDAIYIRTPEKQDILIDGGPSNAILAKLGEAMPFYDREIDIVILTHPHADHLTGLISVLKNYTVRQVYITGAVHTTYEYLEFLTLLKNTQRIQKIKVDHRFTVFLSPNSSVEFLYPDFDVTHKDAPEFILNNLNNTSIVVKLTYNDRTFLFAGDIEHEAEEYLVSRYKTELRAQVLKVAHQGSKTSSTDASLTAVKPETAVIMVGKDNNYGHPHQEVIDRFHDFGIRLLRTDEQGDIVIKN